jgi:hypothetical protein
MFRLFEIVFVCDAGSYPYLKQKVFTQNESGKLLPIGAKYQEFASVFASRPETPELINEHI